jgi:dihydrolipoamide dehydrogenase
MNSEQFDVAIIGAGVGGYVAAIRAAQLGMKVACIDQRSTLGGTCLNVGCIPSKALLHSSHKFEEAQYRLAEHGIQVNGSIELDLKAFLARKDKVVADLTKGIAYLFKKNNVHFIQGTAKFLSAHQLAVILPDQQQRVLEATHIIIATGAEAVPLPDVPVDEKRIVSSTGALSLKKIPNHLVVVGGGYIGLELGSVWRRLGSKVTVVEFQDTIVPQMDREVASALFKALKRQDLEFRLATRVTKVEQRAESLKVTLAPVQGGQEDILNCDVLLSCIGRRPFTQGLNLEAIGLKLDEKGFIPVNQSFMTAVAGVYAIGDVIRGPMLAHKAAEEGVAVAECLAGQKSHVNYQAIPAVVYTYPEVGSVGKTEEELKQEGRAYRVGKFPFSANSRARPLAETEGFVKILADHHTDEVLGVHIIHAEAGTLIAEAALAMEFRAASEDIARTCHAHPTLNEALKEAALNVFNRAIHI